MLRLVIAVDGSDASLRAIDAAARLAKDTEVEAVLLNVRPAAGYHGDLTPREYERIGTDFPGHELSSFVLNIPPHYRSETVKHSGEEIIFVLDGEPAFRALERAEGARAVASETGVVALGGGAPMDDETQAVLEGHVVVFLDVGIADAAKRVGFDASRPLLAINPRAAATVA